MRVHEGHHTLECSCLSVMPALRCGFFLMASVLDVWSALYSAHVIAPSLFTRSQGATKATCCLAAAATGLTAVAVTAQEIACCHQIHVHIIISVAAV